MAGECDTAKWQCIEMMALWTPATTICTMCFPLSTFVLLNFSWKCDTTLSKIILVQNLSRQILAQVAEMYKDIFSFVANKGLIQTLTTAPRLNVFTEAILLFAKLCSCTGFTVWTTFWTNRNINWNTPILLIKCCKTTNFQASEYELLDTFKPVAKHWNSKYGNALEK